MSSKYFFSEIAEHELVEFLKKPTLLAFDYDGTLSAIVVDPNSTLLTPGIAANLRYLSEHYEVVIISGRSCENLRPRIPEGKFTLIGNHGLEGLPGLQNLLSAAEKQTQEWLAQLTPFFAGSKEIIIENKQYSLTVHYRLAKSGRIARQNILKLVNNLNPKARVVLGKKVINVVSESAPHKGLALQEVMSLKGFSQAIYFGDDDTDEDVFKLNDTRIFTVRVGGDKKTSATYYIKDQSEMEKALSTLIFKLKPQY